MAPSVAPNSLKADLSNMIENISNCFPTASATDFGSIKINPKISTKSSIVKAKPIEKKKDTSYGIIFKYEKVAIIKPVTKLRINTLLIQRVVVGLCQ